METHMIFETHAHYDDEAFAQDRENLLASMQEHGIGYIVNACASVESLKDTEELMEKYPFVYGAFGIHPDDAEKMTEDTLNEIRHLCHLPKAVAIGEIGLDYYWHKEEHEHEIQKKMFLAQMEIAREEKLPFMIHSREAAKDTLNLVKDCMKGGMYGGIIHCFSYGKEMAQIYLDMGFYLGKYIYLLDAWDDLQEDFRTKSYNPFLAADRQIQDIEMEKDNRKERVRQILTEMISRACYHFERLPVVDNVEILRNILYSGVWTKFDQKKSRTDKKEWREEG